jgi:hypothetical protein
VQPSAKEFDTQTLQNSSVAATQPNPRATPTQLNPAPQRPNFGAVAKHGTPTLQPLVEHHCCGQIPTQKTSAETNSRREAPQPNLRMQASQPSEEVHLSLAQKGVEQSNKSSRERYEGNESDVARHQRRVENRAESNGERMSPWAPTPSTQTLRSQPTVTGQ